MTEEKNLECQVKLWHHMMTKVCKCTCLMLKWFYDNYKSAQSGFFFQCILMIHCLEIQNHNLVLLATTYFLVTRPKAMEKITTSKFWIENALFFFLFLFFEYLIWGDIRAWQGDRDKEQPPQPPENQFNEFFL